MTNLYDVIMMLFKQYILNISLQRADRTKCRLVEQTYSVCTRLVSLKVSLVASIRK